MVNVNQVQNTNFKDHKLRSQESLIPNNVHLRQVHPNTQVAITPLWNVQEAVFIREK
jgi:hypothetical protein